jgi:V-type H+-transporting ATPase subunit E
VLKARDGLLNDVFAEADKALSKLAEDKPAEYATLLRDVILQGLIKLRDEEVVVRCRKADVALVRDALPAVAETYISKTGSPLTVSVDEDVFLPETCSGGVTLLSGGGRIVVENTFQSRLQIAYEQNLPVIRSVLFSEA